MSDKFVFENAPVMSCDDQEGSDSSPDDMIMLHDFVTSEVTCRLNKEMSARALRVEGATLLNLKELFSLVKLYSTNKVRTTKLVRKITGCSLCEAQSFLRILCRDTFDDVVTGKETEMNKDWTVGMLIDELKKHDSSLPVCLWEKDCRSGHSWPKIDAVEITHHSYCGIPIPTAVLIVPV